MLGSDDKGRRGIPERGVGRFWKSIQERTKNIDHKETVVSVLFGCDCQCGFACCLQKEPDKKPDYDQVIDKIFRTDPGQKDIVSECDLTSAGLETECRRYLRRRNYIMTFYVENETEENICGGIEVSFSVEDTVEKVANAVLEMEGCPYEVQLNVLLTDNDGIHAYNKEYRNIDRETDVLSFPNLDFAAPGDFDIPEDREADYFDPDTGELILGDIIISVDRVREQAESYGHSRKREFAFLVAHSMLHLCGYDHMEPEEAEVMEAKQEQVLASLGITRD